MATIRILLGIICFVSTLSNRLPSGGVLEKVRGERLGVRGEREDEAKVKHPTLSTFNFQLLTREKEAKAKDEVKHPTLSTFNFQLLTREAWPMDERRKTMDSTLPVQILRIAESQIGVREATGNNDGKEVEAYLRYTGNKKGEPWCASFVSWIFGQAGFKQPKAAWSPALFPITRQTKKPVPANVFGIYFSNLKRIAHCGLVATVKGNWIGTIEGNTNTTGSREGDGVYRKLRHERTIAMYANWIKQDQKGALP